MKKYSAVLTMMLLWLSGCQTVPYQGEAHDVKKKPHDAGIVAIPINYRDEDRSKATDHMTQNCAPNPFEVTEEGEVVTGQVTNAKVSETNRDRSEHQIGSLFGTAIMSGDKGGKDSSTSSVTSNTKEWQISYRCLKPKRSARRQ